MASNLLRADILPQNEFHKTKINRLKYIYVLHGEQITKRKY